MDSGGKIASGNRDFRHRRHTACLKDVTPVGEILLGSRCPRRVSEGTVFPLRWCTGRADTRSSNNSLGQFWYYYHAYGQQFFVYFIWFSFYAFSSSRRRPVFPRAFTGNNNSDNNTYARTNRHLLQYYKYYAGWRARETTKRKNGCARV